MKNDSQPSVAEAMVNAVRDALPEGVVADEWLAEVIAAVLRVTVEQCLPERKEEGFMSTMDYAALTTEREIRRKLLSQAVKLKDLN